jgi:hypothetical protein
MTSSVSGCCYRESRLTVSSRERIVTGIFLSFTRKHFLKKKNFLLSLDWFFWLLKAQAPISLSLVYTHNGAGSIVQQQQQQQLWRTPSFCFLSHLRDWYTVPPCLINKSKENGKNAFAFRVRRTRPGELVSGLRVARWFVWNFAWEGSLWLERKRSPGAPPFTLQLDDKTIINTHRQGARRNLCKTHTHKLGEGFASPLLSLNNR